MLKKLLTLILIIFLIFFVILNPKLFSATSQNSNPEIKEDEILLDGVIVKITSSKDEVGEAQKRLDAFLVVLEARMSDEKRKELANLRREHEANAAAGISEKDPLIILELGILEVSAFEKIKKLFESEMNNGETLFFSDLRGKILRYKPGEISDDLNGTLNARKADAYRNLLRVRQKIVDDLSESECWVKKDLRRLEAEEFLISKENDELDQACKDLSQKIEDFGIYLEDLKEELKDPNLSLLSKVILRGMKIKLEIGLKNLGEKFKDLSDYTFDNYQKYRRINNLIYEIKEEIADRHRTPLYTVLENRLNSIKAAIYKAEYFCEHQRR